ncbi:MAG: hypothetical protein KAR38_03050, partial [Calditrichia bacterium]|nr:hypothetical protein [Calditrichia bacterium]
TEEGVPYQRKIVISKLNKQTDFRTVLNKRKLQMTTSNAGHINPGLNRGYVSGKTLQVESEITNDQSPYKKIYNPSHPDADEEGYVLMPNVNPLIEMVDLITASRSYEANLTVIESFKKMAREALEL